MAGRVGRRTSYNVCYTKLLRDGSGAEAATNRPVVQLAGVMVAADTIETGTLIDASMLKHMEWSYNFV